MGKITDIRPQSKNKGRVSLFVDGEFYCGLEKLTAMERRLKIGDEIDEDALRATVRESEISAAFERATRYLGARPRTQKEMRTYLSQKGYDADTVRAVSDKLSAYGYLDDAAYCRTYIAAYRRKFGARKLHADLLQKGVSREVADAALEDLDGQADEATAAAEKYLRSHDFDVGLLTAFLLRRGFDYDTVKEALSNLQQGE